MYSSRRVLSRGALSTPLQGLVGFSELRHRPCRGSCHAWALCFGFQRHDCSLQSGRACASEVRQVPQQPAVYENRKPLHSNCACSDSIHSLHVTIFIFQRENVFHCISASCSLKLLPCHAVASCSKGLHTASYAVSHQSQRPREKQQHA